MKILVIILLISLISCSKPSEELSLLIEEVNTNIIGYLDVKTGAWIRYFTTLPGSNGKPNKRVNVVKGIVPVFQVYDWAKTCPDLKGQKGHAWYRVCPTNTEWVYGMSNFVYKKK